MLATGGKGGKEGRKGFKVSEFRVSGPPLDQLKALKP
jgi:hypothetical protein